jgi:hypothetical protein
MRSPITSLRPVITHPRPQWVERVSHWFRPYELIAEEDNKAGKSPQFRYVQNAVEVWGLQALLYALIWKVFPVFWHKQMGSGVSGAAIFIGTFVLLGFFIMGPGEWFFHRFTLHGLLAYRYMPWLKIRREVGSAFKQRLIRFQNSLTISITYYIAKMAFGHGAHHKITDVTPLNPDRLAKLFRIRNRYEITTNEQTEHAVFPHFSVVGFWFGFFPIIVVVQLVANLISAVAHLPHAPVILAGLLSMSWQVWLYENSHAMMHKPYVQWWKPRMRNRLTGWWWDSVYRFHFFHHMNEKCSLGIVGSVWFNYIWDRVFGTYKLAPLSLIEAASQVNPEVLELSKAELKALPEARPEDFDAPRDPARWVAYLDKQGIIAQEMWNKLFIAALQEVRRRNGPKSPTAGATSRNLPTARTEINFTV